MLIAMPGPQSKQAGVVANAACWPGPLRHSHDDTTSAHSEALAMRRPRALPELCRLGGPSRQPRSFQCISAMIWV